MMSPPVRIAIVGASVPGALVFGVGTVLLVDSDRWAFNNGWIFWAGFFAAAVVVAYIGLAPLGTRSGILHACAGAALLAILSASFVIGIFLPYALELGDRTVDDFSKYSEASWDKLVAALLIAAMVAGAILGAVVGFSRGAIDRATRKSADMRG